MMDNRRLLKNYVLNPRYQFKYIALTVLGGLVVTIMNSVMFYLFTRENYALLVDLSPMTDEVKAQLYAELRHILVWLAVSRVAFLSAPTGRAARCCSGRAAAAACRRRPRTSRPARWKPGFVFALEMTFKRSHHRSIR